MIKKPYAGMRVRVLPMSEIEKTFDSWRATEGFYFFYDDMAKYAGHSAIIDRVATNCSGVSLDSIVFTDDELEGCSIWWNVKWLEEEAGTDNRGA